MAIAVSVPMLAGQNVKKSSQPSDEAWAFDLGTQGYAADSGVMVRSEIPALRSVSFIDDHTIMATFIERVVSGGLHRRDDANRTAPFKLHAVFLDAAGKFLRSQTWDSNASAIGLFPTGDGTYADFEGNVIYKYAHDGAALQTLRISSADAPGVGVWALAISPTGKTMLAQYRSEAGIRCEWIHTDAMTSEAEACQIPGSASIGDSLVAAHEARKNQTAPDKIYISKHGADWTPICTSENAEGCAAVSFISETMLLSYSQGRVELLQPDGNRAFRQDIDRLNEVAQPGELRASASKGGGRVAMLLWRSPNINKPGQRPDANATGESEISLSPRRIVVLDVASKKWIFSLDNKGTLPDSVDFAISPAGDALVMKTGPIVRFFRIAAQD
jgi:hypothetical protein